jgi:hypothetical protein
VYPDFGRCRPGAHEEIVRINSGWNFRFNFNNFDRGCPMFWKSASRDPI